MDNINLIMNKMLIVVEKALVNASQDLTSKPGGIIRLKAGMVDDIRKAVGELQFSPMAQDAWRHRANLEREVQEITGANRVTLGSADIVKDTNQTLGGMELAKQSFNERVAAYGMVMEIDFMIKSAEKIYAQIYQNAQAEDMQKILGTDPVRIGQDPASGQPIEIPRYLAFVFVPPETLNDSYIFKPAGIFTMENKVVKSAQVNDLIKLGSAIPTQFNLIEAIKYNATKLQGIDEAKEWFRDVPMVPVSVIPPEILPMVLDAMQGKNPRGRPPKSETPGLKSGKNGDSPTFSPSNELRRQPTT